MACALLDARGVAVPVCAGAASRVAGSSPAPEKRRRQDDNKESLMAQKPQTFANHTRFDPLFHFFLIPIFAIAVITSLVHFFNHLHRSSLYGNVHSFLIVVLAIALLVLVFKTRLYALKVQDRVIRLEEHLRLMQLLQEPLRSRIPELTEGQLISLRFASDAEVPALVERALKEKLSRSDIKKSIKNWRPDYWRV
jgi:Family of unknown function (DUF6526)